MDKHDIPLHKLEEVLESLFGLSDGELSEDGLESDEDGNEIILPSDQQQTGILGPTATSSAQSQSVAESEVLLSNQQLIEILEPTAASSAQSQFVAESEVLPSNKQQINILERTASSSAQPQSVAESEVNTSQSQVESSDDSDDDDDELWKKVRFSHDVPVENFDSNPIKPESFISNRSSPLTYFRLVFSEEFIQDIVNQSNLYASQGNARDWVPVTTVEMEAFLGMLILMGLHPLPNIRLYWTSDPLFRVVEIADVMTCKRFEKILKYLHLNDNNNMPKRDEPGFDKLYKIRPLLESTKELFLKAAVVTNSHSIDECMIKFKGRSTLKQYMPMKPVKRGFKVWARCDSQAGYLYDFEVYTGKKDSTTEVGLGAAVVKNMCQSLIEQNISDIHVAFDNFFTSTDLLIYLYQHRIFATATVRSDRKNLPTFFKSSGPQKKKFKLDKGKHKWRVNGAIGFFAWMDTKLVHVLSTAFCPSQTSICKRTQKDGTKKEIPCPTGILQYTKRMGGVDRFDQKRGVYPVARKSRRWRLRIFYFLLDAAVTNAHILHMTNPRVHAPMTNLQFRTLLGRNLINSYTSRKRRLSSLPGFITKKPKDISRQKAIYGIPDELRLSNVGEHMTGPLPAYRRCRFCSNTENKKKSKIQCIRCQIPLCVIPCFASFHQP